MILPIVRTAIVSLRRDRAALALSFLLPISFFSIFAAIFGGQHNTTPQVTLIVVDEDRSQTSRQLVDGLKKETSLSVLTRPGGKDKAPQPDYSAGSAEVGVRAGDAPVALIIPKGFGQNPITFGPAQEHPPLTLLNDASDKIGRAHV